MRAGMTADLERLIVLYEPEAACRDRLVAAGHEPEIAAEIAFYLAQATDFETIEEKLRRALAAAGIELLTAALDDHATWLAWLGPERRASSLLWCLTDGFAWYRGSFASSVAALFDVPQFGSPPAAQHMAQDKFRCLALAAALGVRVPPTLLVEDGEPLSPPAALPAHGPYFVKPNTLGAKLGIEHDASQHGLDEAFVLTRRIWRRYGDRALVQSYVRGQDVRVSFMDLGQPEPALGVYAVRTRAATGFPTLADSRVMTGPATGAESGGLDLQLTSLGGRPEATAIEATARQIARVAGLRDYWSMDFRLDEAGTPWFLELEVCPAVTISDFRTYLRDVHGADLAGALPAAVRLAHARRPTGA